uniref:Uncharacterized protein n=1 Tax=Setaria viridis TaxID=4556 RepID=A0A4U6VGG9_SETVI|nr:hypothetical protein SEVIR_3G278400v2 [Setaria viridis]
MQEFGPLWVAPPAPSQPSSLPRPSSAAARVARQKSGQQRGRWRRGHLALPFPLKPLLPPSLLLVLAAFSWLPTRSTPWAARSARGDAGSVCSSRFPAGSRG